LGSILKLEEKEPKESKEKAMLLAWAENLTILHIKGKDK